MASVIPNFTLEVANNNGANVEERLLDLMLLEDGIVETPKHHLDAVKEMFDFAAPEGSNAESMLFETPKKNGKPIYH